MTTVDKITSAGVVLILALVVATLLLLRTSPEPPPPPLPAWEDIPVYTGPVAEV